MAKSSVGISLNVDSTKSMGAPEFLKQRGKFILLLFSQSLAWTDRVVFCAGILAFDNVTITSSCLYLLIVFICNSLRRSNHVSITAKTAVGAEETPVGEWSATRVRTAAHGTAHSGTVQILYGIKGLGGASESIARQLVLTKSSLVERRKNNYEVSNIVKLWGENGECVLCWSVCLIILLHIIVSSMGLRFIVTFDVWIDGYLALYVLSIDLKQTGLNLIRG